MKRSSFKNELFAQFARVGKALGNPSRLELLEFIAQGENTVEQLAVRAGLSVANASQHLRLLRDAGLLATRKDGQFVYYRLTGDDVIQLLCALRIVASNQLAEVNRIVDTYLNSKDSLEPVPHSELLHRVQKGLVTVIDVRSPDEYRQGHVPSAVSIPLSELKERLGEFSAGKEIVAYCRGPYCLLAFEAVAILRMHGIQASRLKDGFPEWKLNGFPIEDGMPIPS